MSQQPSRPHGRSASEASAGQAPEAPSRNGPEAPPRNGPEAASRSGPEASGRSRGEQPYARNEEESERLDRHWNELLQELRLAQTGTQILFAFLLSIAFTVPFERADDFTHIVFAVTLIMTSLAMGLLLAPVSFHRIVFQRRLRDKMIPIAGNLATAGLAFLVAAIAGGLLLALDVALNRVSAFVIVALVLVWFVVFWYVIPWLVRSSRRRTDKEQR